MRRKVLIIGTVLAVLLLALGVFLLSFRSITVVSGADLIDRCPRFARPGREVTVTTAVVSDGEIYLNGVDGAYVRPGEYVFVMPDADVRLKVYGIADPYGA